MDLPPKCYDCGGDLLPESIEDVDELCAVNMLCDNCGAESAVVGTKENVTFDEEELNTFLNSLDESEDE